MALAAAGYVGYIVLGGEAVPSFRAQLCSLPPEQVERTRRGYFEPRSGQISIVPRTPAYMASGSGGWSHSGPWPYLQDVPLVFYGPGVVPAAGSVHRPVTLADVAPTIATLLKGGIRTDDGTSLPEVARIDERALRRKSVRLIVTVVWDGGGWNVLRRWPHAWPNLARLMEAGVSFTRATVGSSPSVTPAVHTTLGSGVFPHRHGITGVPVRDDRGEVVDSFLQGESSRFIKVPTLAELWDEQNRNRARIGMVGYEPWHLGMIGKGAERPMGDRDDAAWLNVENNRWITNHRHYRLPAAIPSTPGLERDLRALDAADGRIDRAWGRHRILDRRDRIEETPAFIAYHERVLENLIEREGYGDDAITDLLFTNFKQIDRVGHYFNMESDEVRDSLKATDEQLGALIDFLDDEVGRRRWLLIVTADHGQQPDAAVIDGYGIDPREVEADINRRFGDVARAVWPTEVFLDDDALRAADATVEDIARFLGDYRLKDNVGGAMALFRFAGRFAPNDRLFSVAVPAATLRTVRC